MVNSGRVQNMGGVMYKKVNGRGRLHITFTNKGKDKGGGGGERESTILEVDNMIVDGRIR